MNFDEIMEIIRKFLEAITTILEMLGFKLPGNNKTPTDPASSTDG